MPGTNDYKAFANGVGANALTPSAWAALTTLLNNGFQTGNANSSQFNTLLRQVSVIAAAVAQLVANAGINAVDDGSITTNNYAITAAINPGMQFAGTVGGTSDAITATFPVPPTSYTPLNGWTCWARATAANTTTTPTFTPNSGTLAAKTIVKGANGALAAGDISGAGYWMYLKYDATLDKFVLLNPATGVNVVTNSSKIQPLTGGTVSSNAMTFGLNATTLDFRSATLSSGTVTTVNVPTLSLTIPSGATLGIPNAVQGMIILLVAYNGGTPVLCCVNAAGGVNLDETTLISPTTISGTATSSSTIYSASAVSANSPFRVVGYAYSTQTTSGTYATAASLVQGMGGQALASLQSLGMGQTWQVLTGSRAAGTTYYNTTGRPIVVYARAVMNTTAAEPVLTVTQNGVSASISGSACVGPGNTNTVQALVPPGASYQLSTGNVSSLNTWNELR